MYKDGYKSISTGMNHKALLDRTAYDVALRLTSSKFYLSALELGSISIHNTVLHTDIDEGRTGPHAKSRVNPWRKPQLLSSPRLSGTHGG